MKAATGNAMLMNIIIVFLVIVMALLVTSISYTKAFRIKNRIVDIIEYYDGDFDDVGTKANITNEINNSLSSVGYRLSGSKKCKEIDNKKAIQLDSNYQVCIYEYDNSTRGKYYRVIAYMYFDVPVLGGILNIPVSGETKVFYD